MNQTPQTARGVVRVSRGESTVELAYRIDGNGTAVEAPLVLCLHGWGMEEDWFARLLHPLFSLPYMFLIPRAPLRAQDRDYGSWYDYDGDANRFGAELVRCEQMLLELLSSVESDRSLSPRTRILLGFSQGGYCGAYVALRHPERFSRLIVSGARIKTEVMEDVLPSASAAGFRVLICHGERDERVPLDAAKRGRDALLAARIDVRLLTFDAGHSIGRTQLAAIADWLTEQ